MTEHKAITRRDVEVALQASKRPKVLEKRLLTKNDSTLQNIILIETELGAEVELHEIRTSESIYILSGTYELILPDKSENLKEGDLAFFPPKSLHGLRCVAGSGKFLAVFSPSADGEVSNEWLRAIYAESWRQYTHENVLSQQRNTLFTSVQAALIAFLAGVSKPLLDITPIQVEGANLSIGLGVLGFFAIVSSVFCLFITFYWDSVTKAGQGYIKVRWAVARMIESQAFLGNIGLANVE